MAPPLAVLRLLLGLLLGRGVGSGLREELTHVERYETAVPQRVPAPLAKRDLSVSPSTYPEHVLYSVHAEGRDYLLHLEKNRELLGQHYTETHYLADGTEVTEKPDVQDHCFYQGHVEGHANSAASISTCSGLSGFFRVNETTFLLKPLEEHEAGRHAVYRASHLRMKRSACLEAALEYDHDPKIAAPLKLYRWKSARLHRGPRYVELVLVVDNEEFRKYKDLHKVQNRMKEIVNHVDKLYQPLGLRVALIGLEVWSNRDKITVSRKAEETLENFLRWRETDLLKRKQHDNVQLITGIDFHDTTVGLAKKLAMCTRDSGGVNQDHSVDPIGAASTMAHEMGHNLGMSHDEDIANCHCPVIKEHGGCVMAAKISTCSEQDMWQFLEDPKTICLLNVPGADKLYGEPVCGNQFVERGEECDCGRPEECSDRCCNATTCQLREGAECVRGDCCQDCKVKAAGVLCRASKNDCDLPEHCTGLSSECPEDVFQENGIPCQGGHGYCYNGACPSHAEQCRLLWGAAAQVAPDECFKHNSRQDRNLHCMTESGRRPCSPKDVKCGTLLCMSDTSSPTLGTGFFMLSFGRFKCKAALDSSDANEMTGSLQLVPTGTKCGEEMVSTAGMHQGGRGGSQPKGHTHSPLLAHRSAMLGAVRTSWSMARRTAHLSAVATGCAITNGSATVSWGGHHRTASTKFWSSRQVECPVLGWGSGFCWASLEKWTPSQCRLAPCRDQQRGPDGRAGCAGAVQHPDRWRHCAAQRQGEEVLPEGGDLQQTCHRHHQPALSGGHPATPAVPPCHRQPQPAQYYSGTTQCPAPCAQLPAPAGEVEAIHQTSASSGNQAGSCHLSLSAGTGSKLWLVPHGQPPHFSHPLPPLPALRYSSRSAAASSSCQAPDTLVPPMCYPSPAPGELHLMPLLSPPWGPGLHQHPHLIAARCPSQGGPEAATKQEVTWDSRAVGSGISAGWQRTTEHHWYLNCSPDTLDSTRVYRLFCALMEW
ncbi:disintegrin and metalloproteinase domain-containing protein 8 isoform X2 [Numida meleagris]|uniref:disintegrin and metalloproteinase domain-containing protein 8 isoform X2 n=1 Tax=Numida meleagris TaxID=8996 RepID=UPI000B3D9598|nr:disintegrin and metalloproteinase domain-containing protein 8 isoform X2 [Numida meleagris]